MCELLRYLLAISIALIAFSAGVDAAGITLQSSDACTISPGSYNVTVTNDQEREDTFSITSLGPYRSWVIFDQLYLRLPAHGTDTFTFNVYAPTVQASGFYYIPIRVYSQSSGVAGETQICTIVKRVDKIVINKIEFSKPEASPGDTEQIRVIVENTGTESFKNVVVSFHVTGPQEISFDEHTIGTLGIGQRTTIYRELPVDIQLKPGTYTVVVALEKDGDVFDAQSNSFVVSRTRNVDRQESGSFWGIVETKNVYFANNGNERIAETYEAVFDKPFGSFVTTSGATTEDADGTTVYKWIVTLGPGESSSIFYMVHYWPFYIAALIVLYGLYLFYITVSRPALRKFVIESKRLKDDQQIFTVGLEIKNTTTATLRNVTLREFVPAIARVYKEFKTEPQRAKLVESGTELVWKFNAIGPGETRAVSYRCATVVGAIDYVRLPPAFVEGTKGDTYFRVHSNSATAGSPRDVLEPK